jgi:hypothetical protein
MDNSEALYPFVGVCPLCGGPIDGLVHGKSCFGGGGIFGREVSGLIEHRCNCCGKLIGLRLRLGDEGVEVVEIDAWAQLFALDCAAAIRKREEQRKSSNRR